ncbi:MAG TPA: double-strand break repair protein AddB [Stellaceae bacterium]|nr:double-strand break repair protein AddB [Stellaceae bacterium]
MAASVVFSIASELPFLDALVASLNARASDDPLALARMTVLLPTRRAARSLAEAFLRAGAGKPLLLPRMLPVGDLDAEELSILADEDLSGDAEIAPPLPDLTRRLMLARLVLAWGNARGESLSAAQATPLAAALARFLDEVETEGCDLAALAALAPEEHARHWQLVLQFLGIVTESWPRVLAESGAMEPAARRNAILRAQAELWRKAPPSLPVIAAGITGSVPAVAELIAMVATMPQGAVVLPGFDSGGDAESWQAIAEDPAHPQHLLARLLAKLAVAPKDVRDWPAPGFTESAAPRDKLIAEALRPAALSDRWGALKGFDKSALSGLRRIDCPGPQEEAAVIALLMRERLEEPGKTAALVTPDRELARRVAGELRRWGIEIDDSAGTKLSQTPPGVFLRLVLQAVAEELAPLALLALLKHPLAACGMAPAETRELARRLELAALRGPRPAPGIAGLTAALSDPVLQKFIAGIGRALDPLIAALGHDRIDLADLIAAHIRATEAMAATDEAAGAESLWRQTAGEVAATFVSGLRDAARDFPQLAGADYPPLFESLLAGPVVRPAYGRHPRLFIWGLLEARLQQADLMILGGLNEGTWPARVDSDPWLSRPMRAKFGLPPPERRIGMAAHDFAQCLVAPRVVLTRATRIGGAPTLPSRFLARLETVLRGLKLGHLLEGDQAEDGAPLIWQRLIDEPGVRHPVAPPAPRPPLSARPRQLSVTAIETWIRDPYAIYARHVLRLRALDPLDADPGLAQRGSFIHAALDNFLQEFPHALPPGAEARLLELGEAAFGEALAHPDVRAFWWPRFERIAQWLVAEERARRPLIAESHAEIDGKFVLSGRAGDFTLTGKADRIDRFKVGGLAILDYKTGRVPSAGEIRAGYAPQLPLEAMIAAAGGFPGIAPAPVESLLYWKLSGGEPAGEESAAARGAPAVEALALRARETLERLVASFDDPTTPYLSWPQPGQAPRYSDYTHLARVKEWLLGAGPIDT